MAALSPTAVFSPSVARQQRIAAKDWTYVDNWLSAKFAPNPPPSFERNQDTLRALINLAGYNEAADDERDLLAAVEAQVVMELQKAETDGEDDAAGILADLEDHLPDEGYAALEAMASASVVLDAPIGLPGVITTNMTAEGALVIGESPIKTLGRRLMILQETQQAAEQAQERVDVLRASLEKETARITKLVLELQAETQKENLIEELGSKTAETQRQAKVIREKAPELQNQVIALRRKRLNHHGDKQLTVRDVKIEEERFRELLGKVKVIEAHVNRYHGLPHDVDLARLEVERAKVELRDLTRQRDMMFEGLVERESPRKGR